MSFFLHSKQLMNVTISPILCLRSWRASSHVPLLAVVYSFSDIVSYFPMFSGKFHWHKNFKDDHSVCILETPASFFSEYNTIFKDKLFLWVAQLSYAVVSQRNTILSQWFTAIEVPAFSSESPIPSPAMNNWRNNFWIHISSFFDEVASSDKRTLGLYTLTITIVLNCSNRTVLSFQPHISKHHTPSPVNSQSHRNILYGVQFLISSN